MLVHRLKPKFFDTYERHVFILGSVKLLSFAVIFLLVSFAFKFTHSVTSHEGVLEERVKKAVYEVIVDVISLGRFFYYLPSSMANRLLFEPTNFYVFTSEQDFGELSFLRNDALIAGRLDKKHKKNFKAEIIFDEQTIKSKVRLKGDTVSDHLADSKWSMSFTLPNGSFLGATKFAIQHPKRRSYLATKIQLIWAELLGLPVNKVEMIYFHLNGRAMGCYQLEEKWGTSAISREIGTDTIVLKFNDDAYMSERHPHIGEAFKKTFVEVIESETALTDPILKKHSEVAVNLLRDFQQGLLSAEEVFDVEKTGLWLALGDVFGTWHGYTWGNLRLAYDPATQRLIPLLWDMANENLQASPRNNLSTRLVRLTDPYMDPNSPFWNQLLGNDKILESYMVSLNMLSSSKKYENLKKQTKQKIKSYLKTLQLDYPQLNLEDEFFLIDQNISYIQKVILQPSIPAHVFYSPTEGAGELIVMNRKQVPLKITGIYNSKTDVLFSTKKPFVYVPRSKFGEIMKDTTISMAEFGESAREQYGKSSRSLVLKMWGLDNNIYIPIEHRM